MGRYRISTTNRLDSEVGIEPTVRHAMDLGYIPIVVVDACGSRDKAAARRTLDSLAFAGGSLQTDVNTICALFRRARSSSVTQREVIAKGGGR